MEDEGIEREMAPGKAEERHVICRHAGSDERRRSFKTQPYGGGVITIRKKLWGTMGQPNSAELSKRGVPGCQTILLEEYLQYRTYVGLSPQMSTVRWEITSPKTFKEDWDLRSTMAGM